MKTKGLGPAPKHLTTHGKAAWARLTKFPHLAEEHREAAELYCLNWEIVMDCRDAIKTEGAIVADVTERGYDRERPNPRMAMMDRAFSQCRQLLRDLSLGRAAATKSASDEDPLMKLLAS